MAETQGKAETSRDKKEHQLWPRQKRRAAEKARKAARRRRNARHG